jgi:MFS transporter, ACS family, D-galactonate transporter
MEATSSNGQRGDSGTNRVLFLLSLSVLINYVDRSNLSIAAPLLKDELHISATQLGTLLSAFFWTYALMQIPAGWLADRFDVKWVFGIGFFVWSVATAVTGILHGFLALLVIRVILGFGESVAFPSYGKIIGSYFKEHRRGFANSAVQLGLALGPALGIFVGGNVVGRYGWRPFFLALGLAALLWIPPWLAWMPRGEATARVPSDDKSSMGDLLRQRSLWGLCICHFCGNYGLYFLITWLPFYLERGRGLSPFQMARIGGLVFLLYAAASVPIGKLSDRWIAVGGSPTVVRKTLVVISAAGVGVFLAASGLAPDRVYVWMLALVGVFMGAGFCNLWAVTQTIAGPRMVGRWVGVQNFLANFAGATAPTFTGIILDRTGQFYWAFFLTAAVSWIGALSWLFFVGPVEAVVWGGNDRQAPDIASSTAAELAP